MTPGDAAANRYLEQRDRLHSLRVHLLDQGLVVEAVGAGILADRLLRSARAELGLSVYAVAEAQPASQREKP